MQMIESTKSALHRLFGLTPEQLDKVLATGLKSSHGLPAYCEIYLQHGTDQGVSFDQGVVKKVSLDETCGAGVRVVIGDKDGYAYTDDVSITNLRKAAAKASAIAEDGNDVGPQPVGSAAKPGLPHNLYPIVKSPMSVSLGEKIELLRKVDAEARSVDTRIKNVSASLGVSDHTVVIVNSLGHEPVVDKRPLVRLNVSCLVEDGKRREGGTSGGGGRVEFAHLVQTDFWKQHARTAAQDAIDMLSTQPAPAGEMTVVLANGWPGVLIHEAVGHGLEGDFNRKGTSAFSNRIGEKVASELCTIIDDGTMPSRRGSLNVDDEGVPTSRTVLIEKGILKGYMQDRMNASLTGVATTGNGRRQSYAFAPIPRMTNTFLDGGSSTPEEIIASVKYGLYAKTFGGGQVDITSGKFTFSATMAWMIEDGKLTKPVKGATLIGNGPRALHHVKMVGNDVALDAGIGTCGKDGQGVPVGVGMPHVRIDNVTVGGTAN